MKVVGEAEVEEIIEASPNDVWKITKEKSGINKDSFDKYYKNKSSVIAYKLSNIVKYDITKELKDYGIEFPPQSFIYVKEEALSHFS